MEKQRAQARASWKGAGKGGDAGPYTELADSLATRFEGYGKTHLDGLPVTALLKDGRPVETVEAGSMTKDLALLIVPEQGWLNTAAFMDKLDENLQAAMG